MGLASLFLGIADNARSVDLHDANDAGVLIDGLAEGIGGACLPDGFLAYLR